MDQTIIVFVIVGFIAQMIDGALGMAYGVINNCFKYKNYISGDIMSKIMKN